MKKSISLRVMPLVLGAAFFASNSSSPLWAAPKDGVAGKLGEARFNQLPPRMVEAIETKIGKPLTDAQKKNLLAAWKKRGEEMRATNERFGKTFTAVTGIQAEEMRGLMRPRRGEGRFGHGGKGGEGRFGGRRPNNDEMRPRE